MEIKHDFSNVLMVPRKNPQYTVSSRSEVSLEREFVFRHSGQRWKGVPIIVSNMDTTGTVSMALELQKYKILTCLHKYHEPEDIPDELNRDYFMISTGIGEEDWKRTQRMVEKVKPKFLCIDVANGYTRAFMEFCQRCRKEYPWITLMGGNIVTSEIIDELSNEGGLDVVKVGLGSGCCVANTKILMADGTYKNINTVQVGESVINREGKPVRVINVMNRGVKQVVAMKVNNWNEPTFVTEDHLYWIHDIRSEKERWVPVRDIDRRYMNFIFPETVDFSVPTNLEIPHFSKMSYVEGISREAETWDIEVDCPTHSFIANNCVVHNSVCTTRLKTGIGYPQLSAIMECSENSRRHHTFLISDGGIQTVGDISKAFGAGADFVMMGSFFAGHEESGGELVEVHGKKYKRFYGMSSATAMNKHHGGVNHYRTAEGKEVDIPYKGDVKNTIEDMLGGMRSALTYLGVNNLEELSQNRPEFILVHQQANNIYK